MIAPPADLAIAARLAEVRARLARAEADAGRAPGATRLIAVSKMVGEAAIRAAMAAGQSDFGENRVQEALAKWPALREGAPALRLHLIGPLQSNKAAEAVALFDAIHTVDREKIAGALAAEMARQGRRPRLLVQVNTGEEPQKAGVPPAEAVAFVRRCREVHGLEIDGLMCIPPASDAPGPHFALLAKLAREAEVTSLSMGMSDDFETAAFLGATDVRVGSAIFGGCPPAA